MKLINTKSLSIILSLSLIIIIALAYNLHTINKQLTTLTANKESQVYTVTSIKNHDEVYAKASDGTGTFFYDNTNYIEVGDKVKVTYQSGTNGEVILGVEELKSEVVTTNHQITKQHATQDNYNPN